MQLTTLSMMSFVLKKAHMNIEYLVDKESQNSDVYTDDEMADLVQQYREALTKVNSGIFTALVPNLFDNTNHYKPQRHFISYSSSQQRCTSSDLLYAALDLFEHNLYSE